MGISNLPQYNLMLRDNDSKRLLNSYRALYNHNNFNRIASTPIPKIPKIIHHIWIGPNPIPELYFKYAAGCKAIHPGWQYKLWREEDIAKENFDPKYITLFNSLGKKYSTKKDVIEYLILHKYGGVVMDIDFKCIKPLDELHHKYDFYASLEPGVNWSKVPVMTCAIVGSKPGNEVFLKALDRGIIETAERCKKKNSLIKRYFRKIKNIFVDTKIIVPCKYGITIFMTTLAKEFFIEQKKLGTAIILPTTYFNPLFPDQHQGENYFTQIRPETIAAQDWND
jgi:hypothetical protein